MADRELNDELLLQLLQCKSQIEQVKRAREECSQQMQTWWAYIIKCPLQFIKCFYSTLELDAINAIISEKTRSAKVFCVMHN